MLNAAYKSESSWILSALAKQLKLESVEQLILSQPSDYYDCRKPRPILSGQTGCPIYTACKIQSITKPKPNTNFYRVDAYDFNATLFSFTLAGQSPFYEYYLVAKQKQMPIYIYGHLDQNRFGIQLKKATPIPEALRGRITPKLPSVKNLATSYEATLAFAEHFNTQLDPAKLAKSIGQLVGNGITTAENMLNAISTLIDRSDAKAYKKALQYFRSVNIKDYLQKEDEASLSQRSAYCPRRSFCKENLDAVIDSSGVELTPSQKEAVYNIVNDQPISKSGNGLLSGDVGTGKSIVIAVLAVLAQQSGLTTAIMAPTSEIADQLIETIKSVGGNGISKLTGDTKDVELDEKLACSSIYVGTTALLHSKDKQLNSPDFLVIDEEHEFGSQQKYSLTKSNTYQLLSTATAIPATMQIAMVNRRKVFSLTDRRYERSVTTRINATSNLSAIKTAVDSLIASGDQVAIVVPIAKKSTNDYHKALSVDSVFRNWEKAYPGKVTTYHGKLDNDERTTNYQRILNGDASIIIATSAIESGLNIPKLRQIIVLEPARYGLRQLHQLRGRVGRYGAHSYFDLLPISPLSESAKNRLNILTETDDGFAIAEKELYMRGFGALNYGEYEQNGHPVHLVPCLKITPGQLNKYNTEGPLNE